jgi:carbonic anhydrase
MTAIDELLGRNTELIDRVAGDRSSPRPSLHIAILTCMDARIRVFEMFKLKQGEAHVLRNAGGVVTDDVIRSLALVHHTECGLSMTTEDQFKDDLEADTGLRPTWSVEAFREVKDSVRTSMARLRRSAFLPHTDRIRGFVYDVRTGDLHEVV